MQQFFCIMIQAHADMAELADALDSGSSEATRASSNLVIRTL